MTGTPRSIPAFALIFAVLAAYFFVPVRRTSTFAFGGPDGSRQRVRNFGTINVTFEEFLRTRGTRADAATGSETTTSLRAGAYALRIGGILLGGGALVGLSALASRRKKKI